MNIIARDIKGHEVTVTLESIVDSLDAAKLLVILYNYLLNHGGTSPIVSGMQVGRVLSASGDAVTTNLILEFLVGFVDTVGHMANTDYTKALVHSVRSLFK